MLKIMNSAMMPVDGVYVRRKIDKAEFRRIFEKHSYNYKSYIGYPNACKIASNLIGQNIALCRDETDIKTGDTILVLKLRYRVNPQEKSGPNARKHGESIEDYDFFQVDYYPSLEEITPLS